MAKISYQDRIVVITGGSSGIGLALAKAFARKKAKVIIIARGQEKLQVAKNAIVTDVPDAELAVVSADVSIEHEITNAIDTIGKRYGRIDVLVNCAGISTCKRFSDHFNEDLRMEMEVNYLGSVYASKAAWPHLKVAGGQLSFVSSVAGYFGVIGYSSYCPTKFAMTGLAECLRFEGKQEGIRVSIIYPPDTETPMMEKTRQNCIPETMALSKNIKLKTAEQVATIYIDGLERSKAEIYCGIESRMVRWIKNNFPSITFYLSNAIIAKATNKR